MLIGCGIVMVFTSVLGLAVYITSYKLIEKSKNVMLIEPINNLFRLVGIILSLMLSLSFSQEINEWKAIKNSIDREAVAISDIYIDLKYFDFEGTAEIRAILLEYAQAVIDDDWPAMANDRLGQRTSALKRQFTEKILELKPMNSIQKDIRSNIIADVDTMSDYRLIRLNHSMAKPHVYVLVIIFGFIVSMACFGAHQPHLPLIALVSLCTLFIGMVIYVILAIGDPLQGAISIDPAPFEYLIKALESGMR
jgi:hypothetical protein